MRIMKAIIAVLVLIIFAFISVDLAFSQDDQTLEKMEADEELQQELKWLKAETYVITPSRIPENIKKTAASISVVTHRQIRQMGARNLTDVLRRVVPGVDLIRSTYGYDDIFVRGATGFNRVLLLINNHPVYKTYTGGWQFSYDDLIIDNIERIEVIRGPGSAVYGANAFHGVINVITKKAEDVDGLELVARGGSWDTQQYNLLYGKALSELEVAFNFNYFKTHGFRGLIEEDLQTQSDEFWGAFGFPPASLAPGRTKGDDEKYDVALNLKFKGFTFDGRYVDKEYEPPVSGFNALTNKNFHKIKNYSLTISYETDVWERLDLYGKVYRNKDEATFDLQHFPPGFVAFTPNPTPPPPVIPAVWPDGLFNNGGGDESTRTGIEIQTTYKVSDSNTIVAGGTYERQKAKEFTLSANYLPTPVEGVIIPLPSVQKWPEAIADEYIMDEETRNFWAVFFEDVWDITDDLRLTLGARYDDYSDFGDHFSPRAGLTWEYMKGYDLKLLYGHAFRAPSFIEYYSPAYGNSGLDPEEVDNYEISFGAEFTHKFNSRITLYHRERKDIIAVVGTIAGLFTYVNRDSSRDQGFDLEMKYDFGRGTYLAGNYNYRNWKTEWPPAPKHSGKVMANIRLSRYLNFYTDFQFTDEWHRWNPEDTRDNMSGYGIVNATLIAKKFLKGYEGLELRGSVYNLFDKDYTLPTPRLPNDLPMPGINYLLEIKYEF